MRRLLIVLTVLFTASFMLAPSAEVAMGATKTVCKRVCKKVRTKARRAARPAGYARGPVVSCPAPVVNVPQQPAPVVNVPSPPPSVGITTDNNYIYIVYQNQLMVLDKCSYTVIKTVPLK